MSNNFYFETGEHIGKIVGSTFIFSGDLRILTVKDLRKLLTPGDKIDLMIIDERGGYWSQRKWAKQIANLTVRFSNDTFT